MNATSSPDYFMFPLSPLPEWMSPSSPLTPSYTAMDLMTTVTEVPVVQAPLSPFAAVDEFMGAQPMFSVHAATPLDEAAQAPLSPVHAATPLDEAAQAPLSPVHAAAPLDEAAQAPLSPVMEVDEEDDDVVFLYDEPGTGNVPGLLVKKEEAIPAIILSSHPDFALPPPPPLQQPQGKKTMKRALARGKIRSKVQAVIQKRKQAVSRARAVQLKKMVQVRVQAVKWARRVERVLAAPPAVPAPQEPLAMCNGLPVVYNRYPAGIPAPTRVTMNKTKLFYKFNEPRKDARGTVRARGSVHMIGVYEKNGCFHPVFNYPADGEIARSTFKKSFKGQEFALPEERARFCTRIIDYSRSFSEQELQQLEYHHFNTMRF